MVPSCHQGSGDKQRTVVVGKVMFLFEMATETSLPPRGRSDRWTENHCEAAQKSDVALTCQAGEIL